MSHFACQLLGYSCRSLIVHSSLVEVSQWLVSHHLIDKVGGNNRTDMYRFAYVKVYANHYIIHCAECVKLGYPT